MSLRIRSLVVASFVVPVLFGLDRAHAQCATWTPDFSLAGTDDEVDALCVFDDGSGPALYAGGKFMNAGGVPCAHVAKWTGDRWYPLGGGVGEMYDVVDALTVFDDGSGPALVAAGRFFTVDGHDDWSIARWNGSYWTSLKASFYEDTITSLATFDDGLGPALYACSSGQVWKWRDVRWRPIGNAPSGVIRSMQVFDDGTGPALYVCGTFESISGVPAHDAARWNGSSWSPMDVAAGDSVSSFAVFDDGTGAKLHAVGSFSLGGTVAPHSFARWNGASWLALGPDTSVGSMESMSQFDDGHGRALFGAFRLASGRTELARWDGAQLTYAHANIVGSPTAYATFDDGHGPALFMGGVYSANGMQVDSIIRWDGATWSPLGATNGVGGVWGQVDTLAVYDDGSGPGLYAGGWTIAGAAGVASHDVVRWDGTSWSAVGHLSWLNVKALMAFDDGSGSKLYAGGKHVERWDGTSWSVVGSELHGDGVQAFAIYDDGAGPALYAGGDFAIHDYWELVNQVAKWDGSHWSRVLDTQGFWPVTCMQVFDDGNGAALYVSAGSYPLGMGLLGTVAKWDGHAWSSLPNCPIDAIQAMTVFDDGSGSALYVGGQFGGVGRWDGHQWTHVGQPMENWDVVRALQVYDDGTGPGLFVTGSFLPNQTSIANGNIAKLVQGIWWPVGAGLNAPGHCMSVFDSGSGPDLYVGGEFTTAGRYASRSIARLHGCW